MISLPQALGRSVAGAVQTAALCLYVRTPSDLRVATRKHSILPPGFPLQRTVLKASGVRSVSSVAMKAAHSAQRTFTENSLAGATYASELSAAVEAVQLASQLCQVCSQSGQLIR
jgi:hypothetical protein